MLYDAMRRILVDDGPLSSLTLYRLPDEQVGEVDTAFVPLSGIGATRALGSQPVSGGPVGVTHDGGVQWYHTGVQFQCRARDPDDPRAAVRTADSIRDVLAQYAGEEVVPVVGGDRIVRCEITTAPRFLEQDIRGRPVSSLTVEVWHRPERS